MPSGAPAARRIEHRFAGGDVNPYLSIAAVLGAALNGLEKKALAPDPITGNAYDQDLPQMPASWAEAMEQFENSPEVAQIFAPDLIRNFLLTKRQEQRQMADLSPEEQVEVYLDTV